MRNYFKIAMVPLLAYVSPVLGGEIRSKSTEPWVSLTLEDKPVIGRPLWVDVLPLKGEAPQVRYPFHTSPHDFGRYSLEVVKDGKPVPEIPLNELLPFDPSGPYGGSVAPASARQGRFPIHAAYRLTSPGHYAIRLKLEIVFSKVLVISDWLEFDLAISSSPDTQLAILLAKSPTDPGEIVGDFLPSLIAYQDEGPVRKISEYIGNQNRLVREFALQCLSYYGDDILLREVMKAVKSGILTQEMGYLFSYRRRLFADSENDIVKAAISQLDKNPAQSLTALRFIRFAKDSTLARDVQELMDKKVLAASKAIIASDDESAQKGLALYAAAGDLGPQWNDVLFALAARGKGREQALIALAWHGDEKNLTFLGDKLLSDDEAAISLPYQLMAHFGKRGEEYVQRGLAQSPNINIRFACARELVIRGRKEAFKFLLENIDWNPGRRGEILQEMRDYVPGGKNLTNDQLPGFLKKQIANSQ